MTSNHQYVANRCTGEEELENLNVALWWMFFNLPKRGIDGRKFGSRLISTKFMSTKTASDSSMVLPLVSHFRSYQLRWVFLWYPKQRGKEDSSGPKAISLSIQGPNSSPSTRTKDILRCF